MFPHWSWLIRTRETSTRVTTTKFAIDCNVHKQKSWKFLICWRWQNCRPRQDGQRRGGTSVCGRTTRPSYLLHGRVNQSDVMAAMVQTDYTFPFPSSYQPFPRRHPGRLWYLWREWRWRTVPLENEKRASIAITTTERFDSFLQSPPFENTHLRCVNLMSG